MVKIEKYGLKARLVEEQDAAFILSLRTDPKLSRFLHPTENDEEKQRAYIRGYKEREKQGKDYYFILLPVTLSAGFTMTFTATVISSRSKCTASSIFASANVVRSKYNLVFLSI